MATTKPHKRHWADLSTGSKALILAGGAVEVVLTGIALSDLARRPQVSVRGPKRWWALGCVVQPVGPLLYLRFGRR